MREEAEILQSTLREITHAVKQDADTTSRLLGSPGGDIEVVDAGLLDSAEDDFLSKRPISPSRAARLRSSSPTRSRSPAHSDNALATVHSAIQKKNMQVMVSRYYNCSLRDRCSNSGGWEGKDFSVSEVNTVFTKKKSVETFFCFPYFKRRKWRARWRLLEIRKRKPRNNLMTQKMNEEDLKRHSPVPAMNWTPRTYTVGIIIRFWKTAKLPLP